MIGGPPFPTTPDELNPEFIGLALGQSVVELVVDVIGAERGMVGQIAFVTAKLADGSTTTPFLAKFAARRDGSRASSRRASAHLRELNFYDQLAERSPVRVPSVIGSWYDATSDEFLILQELVAVDNSIDQIAGLHIDRVESVIHQCGALHASWWNSAELTSLEWLPRLDGDARRTNLTMIAENGWEPLCELIGDELDDTERALGSGLPGAIQNALRVSAARTPTLIHSDLRGDNLLFNPISGEVTIVDWQGVGIGPGAWDVAYLLTQSLTVDDRRAHEKRILGEYQKCLAGHRVELEWVELTSSYADSLVFGLVVATSLPLIGDGSEPRLRTLAASMARRSIEALRDHDRLW
jgi:hypothetical protein